MDDAVYKSQEQKGIPPMELLLDVLRLLVSILIAFLAGNLIAKGKLPSILGWLIAGMLLGPYALGLLGNGILDAAVV